MELELGLKITRTREDVSSSVDFHFSKDPFGPLVLSQETDSSFIIIIHLKGFKKEGIEIDINKEGNRITVRGRKPIEEMVMIRWMVWMREVEFRVFKKVFRIPDIVDLDKIKARFKDDDATLTITMPKRVKGVSGYRIEEEEEEERVDFGEVSEAGEIEEESIEREESDEHFVTEIQREEEFGERESQVLEEEQKDDHLDKIHLIDEQDYKILLEEDEELADSIEENEDSRLRKVPDIEGLDFHEQTRNEEEFNNVVEQKDSQAETNSDDFGSRGFEGHEVQEPDEQLDRTIESEATEKKTTNDDGDGSSKVQGIKEAERHIEESKNQEMVEGEMGAHEKKKIVEMEFKNRDSKEEVDGKMGEGFTPNIDRTQIVGEDDIAETDTKAEEFESDKLQEDKVDKKHELVEKKEEEGGTAKVRRQSEDRSLIKLKDKEEHSKGQRRHDKQEKVKEFVEEQTPETSIGNDILKPVHERCKEIKNQPEEYEEKIMETGKKISDASAARKVQEIIKQQDLDEPSRCEKERKTRELVESKSNDEKKEEKETAKMETNEQESYRSKILGEQEKIQEVAEEKTNFSNNRKVKEEEEIAENKTEFGNDDDIRRKVQDIEQRASDAMKEQEEKVSDGSKGIIAVADTKAEDGKSKNVKETDEQQTHEEDRCGKQFQKFIGGEISGPGGVEDMENEKTISESMREAQEIGRKDSDVPEEYRGIYRHEHEEEKKKEEADRQEKIKGTMEQELVNVSSQLKQDSVEDGEKTRELLEEKTKDCKEKESSEESKTKTNDDVVRKVQGTKEHDTYEPKGGHVSKIKELVEEKTHDYKKEEENEIAESNIEAECGNLRKIDGSEEKEFHEQKIHKESDKTQITGAIEPSGHGKEEEGNKFVESLPITENGNSEDFQEIKKERPDKRESHEKQNNIQEVVEAGHDDHKEGKVMTKAELETEEESSKKIQETEQHEYDGLMRSMVQDKMQEIEETYKDKSKEEKEIVERKKKTKDDSLKNIEDDGDPELSKPYKRQKEDKTQEIVEMGTSDYREKVKKQDEDDILRSHETGRPDLGEPSNIHQLVGEEHMENIAELRGEMVDDSSEKFHEFEEVKSYEDWTYEQQEKRKDLVKEEETNHKNRLSGGKGHNNHKEEEQQEKVISKAEIIKQELKSEADSSKKVREIDKQNKDGLKRSMVEDKMQKTEEKDKTRAINESEIVERREKTKDVSLRKVREGEDPQLGRHVEEDRIQEFMETDISDNKEKVKKTDGDDILRSQETGKLDLGEPERYCKPRKIHHSVEDEKEGKMENISEPGGKMEGDDSSGKVHEFRKQKPYEDGIQEEVKEKATDPKDKHTGGEKGHEEEERYEKVVENKKKFEDEINKKVGDKKEPEFDKHERYEKLDELEGVARDYEKEEENLVDDFTTKIQETEKEESHELKMHEKLDLVLDSVEDETGDQEDEEAEEAAALVTSNETSRKVQTIEEKSERHKEQNKIPEISDPKLTDEDEDIISEKETKEEVPNSRNNKGNKELEENVQELEGKTDKCNYDDEEKGKQGKTGDTMPHESFKKKSDNGSRKIQETNVENSDGKKNQEWKGKIDELVRKELSNHKLKLGIEDECLRKGQEFSENEPNVSKRRTMEEEKFQELKQLEKLDQVLVDEEKAEAETKLDGKSKKFEMSKMLELNESKENEKQKKILKPMEHKSTARETEKEGNGKIAEDEDQEIKGQEPYELQKSGEKENISQYHREEEMVMEHREIEEMKRTDEDVSSRKVQKIKAQEPDGLDNHQKQREIQENHNIQESMGKETHKYGEEEMNEGGGYKTELKTRSIAPSQSQDVEEKESDQPKRYTEQENIQEIMTEEAAKEEYRIREGEKCEKAKTILQIESKANDDSLVKNETESNESTGLRGDKKKENHQELVEIETSDQRKEEKEDEVVDNAEALDKYDCSTKIHEHEERKADKMTDNFAEDETSDYKEEKEENRQGKVLGEVETKIGKVSGIKEKEQDKKRSFVEKDTSGKEKETKGSDDSSTKKTQENEKQESHGQKRNEEHDNKKLGLVGKKTNYSGDEEDGNEDKEISEEEEVPRKLKEIEKRELIKEVERNEDQDDIEEMVEEKMKNQEEEDEKSMIMKVLENADDHESKGPKGQVKQDKNSEQRIRDKLKDEEIAKKETKCKDNESRINKLEEDRTHYCRDTENREKSYEYGSSKNIQETDKEESVQPRRDEKREKIQESVDRETSEDDEEELEVEFEDEEEDWEAEVIQEMDSDEDNERIKQIKRIRLGFRFVGGSTLFMSLIVIVISFIRSKRKIRCYKF